MTDQNVKTVSLSTLQIYNLSPDVEGFGANNLSIDTLKNIYNVIFAKAKVQRRS